MFSKLKQFKDMRSQAKNIQSALAGESAEGSAAWGKVKVVMNGNQEVTTVSIDSELLQEKAKLETALKEATNEVIKKIQKIMTEKVKKMGGLPGIGT
ncbi:YbaB/EbfC family nucleoid-associated protein [Patescibacteria group bacterium]|nr:MAG: YbaB/EbfC family nucleoid-associated protein [Patescibacteria group bacterium]